MKLLKAASNQSRALDAVAAFVLTPDSSSCAKGKMGAPPADTVEQHIANLNSLSLNQCSALARRTEAELQNLSSHLSQLRVAAARLAESREALTQLDSHMQKRKEGEVTEVLVPLTGALYAKGRLQCDDKVLVDIGAGYMLQKTCKDAKRDGERTLNLVSEQQGKLEKMLSEKQKQLEVLVATLNQKVLEKQASAQASAAAEKRTVA
ncbi:prefoldin subunit 5, putative [Eimeria acervulina]|uniref:Prefoldin subunit 5, putative n=1 Tax=Eimeria acervulina TaxID=5801 RepID=U6GM19_EIMAC|nr:prefoldin subunit 5, putative [Eimeria acervulina]CDI79649.1 prefoldin subunit 5, putative [Eimeria acervulina]